MAISSVPGLVWCILTCRGHLGKLGLRWLLCILHFDVYEDDEFAQNLVTISVPLGRKGLPTIASMTELLPELWLPTVITFGQVLDQCTAA